MDFNVSDFLCKKFEIEKKIADDMSEDLDVRQFTKGTVLIKQGQVADKCFFVLDGCLRQYFVNDDGNEFTYDFFTSGQAAVIFSSYMNNEISGHFVECVCDSILLVGDKESEQIMYEKYPELVQITRNMMADNFGQTQEKGAEFMSSTPQKRVEDLCKNRPDLIKLVPQYQLASYLGISPESFSRIKKRLKHPQSKT